MIIKFREIRYENLFIWKTFLTETIRSGPSLCSTDITNRLNYDIWERIQCCAHIKRLSPFCWNSRGVKDKRKSTIQVQSFSQITRKFSTDLFKLSCLCLTVLHTKIRNLFHFSFFLLNLIKENNTMKLGRKRVLTSPTTSAPKRRRNGGPELETINIIESLPQDLLVKVMCKVDFRDLKHLNLVSETFRAAAKVAKDIHPSYSTPIKQDRKGVTNMENYKNTPDVVVRSVRHNYSYSPPEKDISAVAVILFEDDEDYLD